ncbi:hypothetical protein RR46_02495 [Papilio xuthus]|uniref:Uncharacterized protein n=1 Tax=Papilio xuthus TaxID=66420 RepID=A0A194QGX9_PAPXU|nr:hypothetical protein RR46_02495 [Papilio xuthus]
MSVSPSCEFLQRPRLQIRPGLGCAPDTAHWPPLTPPTHCAFLSVADLTPHDKLHLARSAAGDAGDAGDAGEAGECTRCAVLVAPMRLAAEADALVRRVTCPARPLRILLWEPLFALAAAYNHSLLLFDKPLEAYDSSVRVMPELPYCNLDNRSYRLDELNLRIPISKKAITIGIHRFAPHVRRVVETFAPSAADIRKVLAYKLQHDGDMEKCACDWALSNLRQTDRASEDRVDLTIRLFLCRDDPDRAEYENMCKAVFGNASIAEVTTVAAIIIEYKTIDCERGDVIGDELFSEKDEWKEQHVVGWLAASAGAGAALKAERMARPLLAYGAPPTAFSPNRVVRGVAGSTRLLALAFLHLLEECGVRRLAVLTERTALTDEFTDAIRHSYIVMRQRNVTSLESIESALREFRDADARVYFVNANATVCAEVICAARRLRMAAGGEYLWLVREWRAAGRCGPGEPRPLALGVAWRGAAGAEWWPGGARALEALEARWHDRAWPPLAAPILDGLRLLNRTVADFVSSRPDSVYDRYVFGNAQ